MSRRPVMPYPPSRPHAGRSRPERATIAALILLLAVVGLAGSPTTASSSQLDDRLERALERSLARTASPGVQAAIVDDGLLVFDGAAGAAITRPRERVTETSLFSFASFSKMMLAAYALDLVERGKLSLDRPIRAYVGKSVPGSGRVTLRMLLAHTAGYPEVYSSPELSKRFGSRYDPNRRWGYPILLKAIDTPRRPGRRYRYSNAAYIALSFLLRRVIGPPLNRAYARFIAPAGLSGPIDGHEVTIRRTRAAAARFTHGYELGANGRTADAFAGATLIPTDLYGLPWGDGLFAGTARGAAQFLDGLLVRRTLLEDATLAEMTRATRRSRSAGEPYGLGTFPVRAAGRRWLGHDGSYAGYTSMGFTDRKAGVTIVVLANGESANPAARPPASAIWRRLAHAYFAFGIP